jgi:DNA-binding CsgD family transcriptional regulator
MNAATTPQDLAIRARALGASDVAELLPQLRVPTLVLHPRDHVMLPASSSMKFAARIPGAHFRFIEGEMLPGDPETGIRAIEAFLSELPAGGPHEMETSTQSSLISLSERETEVLSLIARGLTNQQIADQLVISIRTVERHINHIYDKTGARSKAQATALALRARIS